MLFQNRMRINACNERYKMIQRHVLIVDSYTFITIFNYFLRIIWSHSISCLTISKIKSKIKLSFCLAKAPGFRHLFHDFCYLKKTIGFRCALSQSEGRRILCIDFLISSDMSIWKSGSCHFPNRIEGKSFQSNSSIIMNQSLTQLKQSCGGG